MLHTRSMVQGLEMPSRVRVLEICAGAEGSIAQARKDGCDFTSLAESAVLRPAAKAVRVGSHQKPFQAQVDDTTHFVVDAPLNPEGKHLRLLFRQREARRRGEH